MAVPVPRTYVAGELLNATILNGDIRDTQNFLLAPPSAKAYRTANKAAGHDSWVLYDLNVEAWDWPTTAMHDNSTNNSRIIAPEPGKYFVETQTRWAADADGHRSWMVRKNSASNIAGGSLVLNHTQDAVPAGSHVDGTGGMTQLSASDYLELFTYHNAGASIDLEAGEGLTFLGMTWAAKL